MIIGTSASLRVSRQLRFAKRTLRGECREQKRGAMEHELTPKLELSVVLHLQAVIDASASGLFTDEPGIRRTPCPKSSIAVLSPRLEIKTARRVDSRRTVSR